MPEEKKYVLKADEIKASEQKFSHPWNPKSEIRGTRMGLSTGLKRTGVNLTTVPPGKESFVYHAQLTEEEWIYVLSGKGTALVDGKEHEVTKGDFLGFPEGVAHNMRNDGEEDLVYLVGGENNEFDIADFPEHGKIMVKMGHKFDVYDKSDAKNFWTAHKEE